MNLDKFNNYRHKCPFCSTELKTCFVSKNKSVKEFDETWSQVFIDLSKNAFSKSKYSGLLSINNYNNTFFVDFLNKRLFNSNIKETYSSKMLDIFIRYANSLQQPCFYRYCNCHSNYKYISNYFSFDFKNSKISDIEISSEHCSVSKKTEHKTSQYSLVNNHRNKTSEIFMKSSSPNSISMREPIKTSMIKISDNIHEKLERIIILS